MKWGERTVDRLFFVGIGGIGMSGLARYAIQLGLEVAGYDKTPTDLTAALEREGASIGFEPNTKHFDKWFQPDKSERTGVVKTPAVPSNHPLFFKIDRLELPVVKRSEMLGIIAQNFETFAVAGTHGKTTTTAMLAHLLSETEGGCNAFLGGILISSGSNVVLDPLSKRLIVEADEFDRSFLQLNPMHAVITSMDPDHLDVYGDAKGFLAGFDAFSKQVTGNILYESNIAQGHAGMRYGCVTSRIEATKLDYAACNPRIESGWMVADIKMREEWFDAVKFPMPGVHNLTNALAALSLSDLAGADRKSSVKHIAKFKGIQRRFAYHIRDDNGTYIDDYAHHPNEISAVLEAIRLHHAGKSITVIFQPHLFSRTRDHMEEFASILSEFDRVLLLPIYPARESPIPGIDSQSLFENILTPHKHLVSIERIFDTLKEHPPEVLLTIGAGDVDQCVQPLSEWLKEDPLRFKRNE
jgi:UDP-N-acetylmuramate--alanine ligase|tara:strand:- start:930 stop:2336 length:1407 start_codon:yes stop_codon:yes gene_type:complete